MSDDFDVITGPAAPLRPAPPTSLPPPLSPVGSPATKPDRDNSGAPTERR